MSKVIQVLKPKFRTEEILDEIRECLEKGWTGIGYKTEMIENDWKAYSGFEYAHFLNSATSGLHLSIRIFKDVYGWTEDNEIITTAFTFVSTNHAILYERLTPVFADIDETLCLDPVSVVRSITNKTKAIIYVGIGGNAAHYNEIRKICDDYNLVLILDAAHMAGTRWLTNKVHVGLDSDCAIFSFQAVKNCPSADAGMICFKTAELDSIARKLSWLGIDKSTYSRYTESSYKWRYDIDDLGFKYHGNSIMASICIVSLKYLEVDNEKRRELALKYDELLNGNNRVITIKHAPEVVSSRHTYQILVDNRDEFIEKLAQNNIFCGVHYVVNSDYRVYSHAKNNTRLAKYFSDKVVSLPLHLELDNEDISRIVEVIS